MTAADRDAIQAALTEALRIADDAIVGVDAEQRIIYFNEGAERIFGYAAEEVLGRPLDLLVPADRAVVHRGHVQRFGESSQPSRAMAERRPIRARRKDGTEFPAEAAISHARTSGRLVYTAILRDLTERHRWEALLQGLVEGTSAATGEDFLRVLVRALSGTLQAKYAFVSEPVPDRLDRMRTLAVWDGAQAGTNFEYHLPGSPCERGMAGESTVYSAGVRQRFPQSRMLVDLGAEACICVPLRGAAGQPIGILAVVDTEPMRHSAEATAILSVFAGRAASELERLKTEAARLEQQAILTAIFEGTTDPISVKDIAGRYIMANTAAAEALHTPMASLIGRTVNAVLPAQTAEPVRTVDRRVMESGKPEVTEEALIGQGPVRVFLSSKHPWRDAQGKVIGLITVAKEITERKRAEELLRRTTEELRGILESAPEAIFTCGVAGEVLAWNPAATRLFGWPADEAIGHPLRIVPPDQATAHTTLLERVLTGETLTGLDARFLTRGGRTVEVALSMGPLKDVGGKMRGTLHIVSDVTAQRDLERRYQQAQKLEAIGRLAGGIAHDFNNILTVILGCADLLIERLPAENELRSDAWEIHASASRAADLTRQLLAFSRQQVLRPAVIDLNRVVAGIDKMLQRLIGEDVALVTRLAPDLGPIRADQSQLEQLLMNLAVNARDAMPEGGRLTIETDNTDLDAAYCLAHPPASPGPYVRLVVTDSGQGMDQETLRHAFEPFFTTKPSGKGTGLGLSVVYGVVKQSGGYIWVCSERGRGTSFKIYLPRLMEVTPGPRPAAKPSQSLTGSETILLAEDDMAVRAVARRILEEAGYTVLAAANGTSALELVTARGTAQQPALLVTDVIMPDMTGPQLAGRVRATWAGIRLLYVSGYPEKAMQQQEPLTDGAEYLQKPFTPEQLLSKVREVLDAGSPA